jgi:acetyltransferase-like isoleucine patch superfamily enzyme
MLTIKRIIKKLYFIFRSDIRISLSTILNADTRLEGYNRMSPKTDVSGSEIGLGTYIGRDAYLVNSRIGRFCSIAPRVRVLVGNHPTRGFVSTHPAFFSIRRQMLFTFVNNQKFEEFNKIDNKYSVEIGNDVWIGSDVLILEGVRIGNGAIIGAGCVVSKNVEPYSIYVGNPMRCIRYRFSEEEISQLLSFRWWDKSLNWLRENAEDFDDLCKILEKQKEDVK